MENTVTLQFDQGTILLAGNAPDLRQASQGGYWAYDTRVGRWRCDAFHYRDVRRNLAKALGPNLHDEVMDSQNVKWKSPGLPLPRDSQTQAVEAWRNAGGRGLIVMPTGTGKTHVALMTMERMACSTLIVAPIRDLMYQWHSRILSDLGYDAGIVGDNLFNLQPVTVTTYDSAAIHMKTMGNRFDLIVFDEAHHLPGKFYREAALMCAARFRMGLTATPERVDGLHRDLEVLVGPTVFSQEIADVAGRTLADYTVMRIPVALKADEQKKYDRASAFIQSFMIDKKREKPKYDWIALLAESGKDPEARKAQRAYYFKKSIEDRALEKLRVLEDLFRLHHWERILVFTGSNAMAIDVSRRFLVPTILSHSKKKERHAVLEKFANGDFPVLVANKVLDEGVDIPAAKVAVVLGGMGNTRQAKQRLGRVLRRAGNVEAVLYEVVSQTSGEVKRSRSRRRSDAYQGTRHRRL